MYPVNHPLATRPIKYYIRLEDKSFFVFCLLNPLPDDKILNLSKLKAFAGEKINVSEKLKFP